MQIKTCKGNEMKVPCEDCITLPICINEFFGVIKDVNAPGEPISTDEASIILSNKCSILSDYINKSIVQNMNNTFAFMLTKVDINKSKYNYLMNIGVIRWMK